ncbi:MAG: hypothetical protein CMH91_07055 [Oceanicaulis sp.]|jgi:hypothetical protein|uniref:hypothetical protein n=1 Tax=unclassified Oceanicaulis TaxID=2632123 RepID=UPI000C67C4DD|nr:MULTISPECIES: hypothetical protein [unclassified Oceanicaulis]MAB69151.1 hypothetical protein [Oceanicaulis sp.]MBC38808.1 hypothetical protein [Oceanicaulis sp.]MBG36224.1 hypothetical protein [Oceanicaulis sp.]HBU61381.1 hypothetical protein [Oceanicaulis sp.]HCR95762.1 hypothetical protein [Oceanicaulis sp.]|tara:strand:- start:4353 stop:4844 length:492 start_codon:yes stop_codon:yes gene_type:complete
MKTVLTALALAGLGATAAQADCYSIYPQGAGQEPVPMVGYSVTEAADLEGLMDAPPLAEGANAIACERDSIVPRPNDFELVRYHSTPLLISTGEGENAQMLILGFQPAMEDENGEMTEPQYRVQMAQGGLNDDERTGIIGALEGFAESEQALDAYLRAQEQDS